MSSLSASKLLASSVRESCLTNLSKVKVLPKKLQAQGLRRSAVLVPLCSIGEQTALLYTVRSSRLRSHAGEVSFPGGRADHAEAPVHTALRETREEIGLDTKSIEVWGEGPLIPGKNNSSIISPVIGSIKDIDTESLRGNPNEVKEILFASLELLCDKNNQYHTQFRNGFILPVFNIKDYKIWGITAYITHLFLTALLPRDVYKNDWMKKKITLK